MMGEAGSGKSESAKTILKAFTTVAAPDTEGRGRGTEAPQTWNPSDLLVDLPEMILATNTILEAFGYASTGINPHSSRFGKYIKIGFHQNKICRAYIETFNLDKYRVSSQVPRKSHPPSSSSSPF